MVHDHTNKMLKRFIEMDDGHWNIADFQNRIELPKTVFLMFNPERGHSGHFVSWVVKQGTAME